MWILALPLRVEFGERGRRSPSSSLLPSTSSSCLPPSSFYASLPLPQAFYSSLLPPSSSSSPPPLSAAPPQLLSARHGPLHHAYAQSHPHQQNHHRDFALVLHP